MKSLIEPIIGKKFGRITRAADMLCLLIGEDYTIIRRGKEISASEFAIHFQTQWRFVDGSSILLGSRDIYEPYSRSVSDDWAYDIIGREDEESSVFDVKARNLNLAMKDETVADAVVSDYGDFIIAFSNGVTLQSFTPASEKSEEWRFIDFKANRHIIVYENEE